MRIVGGCRHRHESLQRVMLDNMSMEDMREAAGMLNRLGVETEASGNVTLDTIGNWRDGSDVYIERTVDAFSRRYLTFL